MRKAACNAMVAHRHRQEKPCHPDAMDVAALWDSNPEERAAAACPVAWENIDPTKVRVLLALAPKREMRARDLDWPAFPRLEVVKLITAGANHVGWSTLPAGVRVATTPGATAPYIAEWILGAILDWCRGYTRFTREIQWGEFRQDTETRALAGLRICILGAGGIGQATAGLLESLGCVVSMVARHDPGRPWTPVEKLADACRNSDVLIVAVPLRKETTGMVDANVLAAFAGRPALLVNVARGPIVDERALYGWLQEPQHGAALDVWWRNPTESGDKFPFTLPFQDLQNVIMTPHNSPNVEGYTLAMIRQATQELQLYLQDGTLLHEEHASDY